MRHNFVNDIGDYAKYALLRALSASGPPTMRLGVIWYLTEHAEQNNDGRKRAHLVAAGWEDLDPDLLASMRRVEGALPSRDQLSVSLIETAGILPPSTAFFSEPMPRVVGTGQQRAAERAAWFERARKAMADCDLVFLDPDNGLEVRSVPITSPLLGKYAMVAEVATLLQTGAGVVLYQHGSRTPWTAQRERVCAQIAAGADRMVTIRSLRFGAFGARAFFCITSDRRMSDIVEHGLDELRQRAAGWDKSSYLSIELRGCRARRIPADSKVAQPEDRSDVRRKVPIRLEHLTVIPYERLTVVGKLTHIRAVHFPKHRVEVNTVGQGRAIYNIDDIG